MAAAYQCAQLTVSISGSRKCQKGIEGNCSLSHIKQLRWGCLMTVKTQKENLTFRGSLARKRGVGGERERVCVCVWYLSSLTWILNRLPLPVFQPVITTGVISKCMHALYLYGLYVLVCSSALGMTEFFLSNDRRCWSIEKGVGDVLPEHFPSQQILTVDVPFFLLSHKR